MAVPSGDNSAVPGNVRIGQGSSPGHSVGPVSFSAKRGQQSVSLLPSQVVLRLQTSRGGSQSCRGRAKRWALGLCGRRPGKERGLCVPLPRLTASAGQVEPSSVKPWAHEVCSLPGAADLGGRAHETQNQAPWMPQSPVSMVTAEGFAPWYLPSLPPPEAGAQEPGVGLAGPRPGFLGTRGPGGAKIGVPLQSGAFWVRTAQIKVCDVFWCRGL